MSGPEKHLPGALGLAHDQTPYPWQKRLLEQFQSGEIPSSIGIPTGAGKTSVMGIALLARAFGAKVPRRIVYAVDRRVVVDQATTVAQRLRDWAQSTEAIRNGLGLDTSPWTRTHGLPISTLRGRYIENRAWRSDPSSAAIITTTVDMLGSRLLFQGYRVSPKMRSFHAGLLSHDTLVFLDEAHLTPSFERLLQQVVSDSSAAEPDVLGITAPFLQYTSLSATLPKRRGARPFFLSKSDWKHPDLKKRLTTSKRLQICEPVASAALVGEMTSQAIMLLESRKYPQRCIVYTNRREDARKVHKELVKRCRKRAKSNPLFDPARVELLVGSRRLYERENAEGELKKLGLLPGDDHDPATTHVVLVATSAGEVGIDLDADVAVFDVVSWQRTVQRLGRVGRKGESEAAVTLVPQKDHDKPAMLGAVLEIVEKLPVLGEGLHNASVQSVDAIGRDTADEELMALLEQASEPEPLYPPLERPILKDWSMTSLPHHAGRADVQYWIRGYHDGHHQVSLAWRDAIGYFPSAQIRGSRSRGLSVVSTSSTQRASSDPIEAYLELTPLHPLELLECDWSLAKSWLKARAKKLLDQLDKATKTKRKAEDPDLRLDQIVAIVVKNRKVERKLKLSELENFAETFAQLSPGKTVVLDARVAGLSDQGLLDASVETPATVADCVVNLETPSELNEAQTLPWRPDEQKTVGWRIQRDNTRLSYKPQGDDAWKERGRIVLRRDEEGAPVDTLVVERTELQDAAEDGKSVTQRAQTLASHHEWTLEEIKRLGERLGLSSKLRSTLETAASIHDQGKSADCWQRAFQAPKDAIYAKTTRSPSHDVLNGYRHELGTLMTPEFKERVHGLPSFESDLVKHLVVSHHGHARPTISERGCQQLPPSKVQQICCETALRFEALQESIGPWRLAYLEALVRSADHLASWRNDTKDSGKS